MNYFTTQVTTVEHVEHVTSPIMETIFTNMKYY